jgi:hypothetical protein
MCTRSLIPSNGETTMRVVIERTVKETIVDTDLPKHIENAVRALYRSKQRIAAIALFRGYMIHAGYNQVGLREAKDFVDRMETIDCVQGVQTPTCISV